MIRKPFVGKKVVILNSSKCCCSGHEVDAKGTIEVSEFPTFPNSLPIRIKGLRQWHCLKCLGPRR